MTYQHDCSQLPLAGRGRWRQGTVTRGAADYDSMSSSPAGRVRLILAVLRSTLLVAAIIICLPSAAACNDQATAAVQSNVTCNISFLQLSVDAAPSCQAVVMTAASPSFLGQCSVLVRFRPTAISDTQPAAAWQRPLPPPQALLLLMVDMSILKSHPGFCDKLGNSLSVYPQKSSQEAGNICKDGTQYVWANVPVELRMSVTSAAAYDTSFAFTYLLVAWSINICQLSGELHEVQVDNQLYVLAADSRYLFVPPNKFTCSENISYKLTFTTSGMSRSLNLTVLTAPAADSCWSLMLDGRRCGDGIAMSVESGTSLLYSHDGGIVGAGKCTNDSQSGFTVKAVQWPGWSLSSVSSPIVSAAAAGDEMKDKLPAALQLLAAATACAAAGAAVAAAGAVALGTLAAIMHRKQSQQEPRPFELDAECYTRCREQSENPLAVLHAQNPEELYSQLGAPVGESHTYEVVIKYDAEAAFKGKAVLAAERNTTK